MTACVALLRGINVGGHNKLPMQDLCDIFESLGCEDVRTYIQSGNAVFRTAMDPHSLSGELVAAIDERFGFAPGVLILGIEAFRSLAAANPYTAAEADPAQLHISFLAGVPADPDLESLEQVRAPSESFELIGGAFYLHAPDGIGRSKLAARVERALGVEATGRNWRTVARIMELADGIISKNSAGPQDAGPGCT